MGKIEPVSEAQKPARSEKVYRAIVWANQAAVGLPGLLEYVRTGKTRAELAEIAGAQAVQSELSTSPTNQSPGDAIESASNERGEE